MNSNDRARSMSLEMERENKRLGRPRENTSRYLGRREFNLERARQASDDKYRRAARYQR